MVRSLGARSAARYFIESERADAVFRPSLLQRDLEQHLRNEISDKRRSKGNEKNPPSSPIFLLYPEKKIREKMAVYVRILCSRWLMLGEEKRRFRICHKASTRK
eukprot:TRINITY_DN1455_c0_g1_i1.p1 TRINITY_DN1455_c0_g1~~TRINITY_DN1455_c0_g1_i1.p1  ORF type:complete len:104 (+),score=16.37 TRINITY_DN1455_c0_g1_i1:114-425(+)